MYTRSIEVYEQSWGSQLCYYSSHMTSETSLRKRWEIVFLSTHTLGPKKSKRAIATHAKVAPSTVSFWLKRYETTGDVEDLERTRHPPAISEKQGAALEKLAEKYPEATSTTLTEKLKCRNMDVTARTVRRRLHDYGKKFGTTMMRPLLSETHCKKRLQWAKNNQDTDWDTVLFTDKTTIKAGVKRKLVWHRPGHQCVLKTVKHL